MGNPNILPTKAIHVTPVFLIGITLSFLGSYIRLDCFKALGHMFTFDLTVHPEHSLITDRFYTHVRHPAYTGSMLLIAGFTISHLTDGSWMTECGPLTSNVAVLVVWAALWFWTGCVALSRALAEDAQMKKLFKDEWKVYAANVPWWFVPGVL
jgi:protein-S-isoprenylcysteine O-methyltransferase Ste14